MKNSALILALFIIFSSSVIAQPAPLRWTKEVNDVTQPYSSDWIISPMEEPQGDQNVSNAPECDIRGVIACNDSTRIRVDILLYNSISYRWKVFYAVQFEYGNNVEEGYIFYPVSKRFFYVKWENGRVVEDYELTQNQTSDWTGVTTGYVGNTSIPDGSVYLIIDKDKHLTKQDYGQKKWVTATFYSGFLKEGSESLNKADETITVRLGFIR